MSAAIETDVAVVGAGIAGLTAADALTRAGRDVVVVEIGGQANELGGQWIAPYQTAAHELLRELGLELFHAHREGDRVYVDGDGRAHRYAGQDAPIGPASEKAYGDAVAKLDALAGSLDPEAPWDHPDAVELDSITYESWLQREVVDEHARDLLRSFLAGGFMTKPAHTVSLLGGLWVIAGPARSTTSSSRTCASTRASSAARS
jgi:putrescine oxidase